MKTDKAQEQSQAALNLRGYFVLPNLLKQGYKQRLGRGELMSVTPVIGTEALIVSSGGAGLFDLRTGHAKWEIDSPARCGALSPDGGTLALAYENTIYLWDLESGDVVRRLYLEDQQLIQHIAFNPTGGELAIGSRNRVFLWSLDGTTKIAQLELGYEERQHKWAWVTNLVFSPTGQILAASTGHSREGVASMQYQFTSLWCNGISLWSVATGEKIAHLADNDCVSSVAFSPDGHQLVSGGFGRISLWNVAEQWEISRFRPPEGSSNVAFCPNGRYFASTGQGVLRLWETSTLKEVKHLKLSTAHTDTAYDVKLSFSKDGFSLITANPHDGTVRQWDFVRGRELHSIQIHTAAANDLINLSRNRRQLATTYDNLFDSPRQDLPTVTVFDSQTSTCLWYRSYQSKYKKMFENEEKWWRLHAIAMAFSPNSRYLGIVTSDRVAVILDASTGRKIQQERVHGVGVGYLDKIQKGRSYLGTNAIVFSPDSRMFASCLEKQALGVWRIQTGFSFFRGNAERLEYKLDNVAGSPTDMAFSSDGRYLAAGGAHGDVDVWDVSGGRHVGRFDYGSYVASVALSRDGRFVAADGGRTAVLIWDADSGREVHKLEGHKVHPWQAGRISGLAFSPDDRILATTDDYVVRLWDLLNGQEVKQLIGFPGARNGLAFSDDGNQLSICAYGGTARIVELT